MHLTSANEPIFLVSLALLATAVGLAGRKWVTLQSFISVLAPIASSVPFIYFLTQATVTICTNAAATRCEQEPYFSTWSTLAWLLMVSAMLLSLAPLASLLIGNRLPSIIAAARLLILVSIHTIFLWSWTLPVAGLFAAAIAGVPKRRPSPGRGADSATIGGVDR